MRRPRLLFMVMLFAAAINAAVPSRTVAADREKPATRKSVKTEPPVVQDVVPVPPKIATAKRVVFVIDATANAGKNFEVIVAEITRSLSDLRPTQSYKVFLYADGGKVLAEPIGELQAATPENVGATTKWLKTAKAAGRSDPLPALQAGIGSKPDLLFFLVAGKFDDAQPYKDFLLTVTKAVKAAGSRVKINTILFESQHPPTFDLLSEISRETLGSFFPVSVKDLTEK